MYSLCRWPFMFGPTPDDPATASSSAFRMVGPTLGTLPLPPASHPRPDPREQRPSLPPISSLKEGQRDSSPRLMRPTAHRPPDPAPVFPGLAPGLLPPHPSLLPVDPLTKAVFEFQQQHQQQQQGRLHGLPFASMSPYPLGKKLFGCPQCRYVTDRKNNLKRHVATMHQDCDKVLECCGVAFKNKASLRDHVLIFHSNGYMCRFCGRNFCRKALLKRHLAVHSGQKDFLCARCDYATSHKSNLERHKRVHDRTNCGDDDEDDEELDEDDDEEIEVSDNAHNHHHHHLNFMNLHHPAFVSHPSMSNVPPMTLTSSIASSSDSVLCHHSKSMSSLERSQREKVKATESESRSTAGDPHELEPEDHGQGDVDVDVVSLVTDNNWIKLCVYAKI